MKSRYSTKLIRLGHYPAEIDVELILTDDDRSPYQSVRDGGKLDDVRDAVERGDLKTASRLARVFSLTPVANVN